LEQYIYYLEVKFNNTDMDREFRNKIDEILHINNQESLNNKYYALKNISDLVPEFTNAMNRYKNELAKNLVDLWLKDVKDTCEANLILDEEHTIDAELFSNVSFTVSYSSYGDNIPC